MNKQIRNKIAQNEEGSGLVLALMVLLVLSVLGATLGVVTVGSYRLADHTQESNSAYYIAEAGANMAYEEIKHEVQEGYEKSSSLSADTFYQNINPVITGPKRTYLNEFASQSGNQPEARIIVEGLQGEGDQWQYTIVSTGEVSGKTRVVEKEVQVNWIPKEQEERNKNPLGLPKNAAVIFNGLIDFGQNLIDFTGDVIHDGSGEIDKNNDNNEVSIDENINWGTIDEYASYRPDDLDLLSDYEHQTISSDKIVIDAKGETINLKLPTLDRSVEIVNGGKVNLYVENIPNGNHKYNLNTGEGAHPRDLNLFYFGANFELGQGAQMNGLLFAPNATVTLGNEAIVNGSIVANKVEFKNKSSVHFPTDYNFDYPWKETTDESDQQESETTDLITSSPSIEN